MFLQIKNTLLEIIEIKSLNKFIYIYITSYNNNNIINNISMIYNYIIQ